MKGPRSCSPAKRSLQFPHFFFPQNIRFMRLSSEMFPFASHGVYGYDLSYAQEELQAAGDLARKYGHRLTTHPGQFTQLGSPRKEVVHNAVKDLQYHCEMLDRMGLDQDSVMIIHVRACKMLLSPPLTPFNRARMTDIFGCRAVASLETKLRPSND